MTTNLSVDEVIEIRNSSMSVKQLASKYKVSRQTITNILKGRTYKGISET